MIQEQEQTAPATIDGAATVASEILGKLLPEPFDEWGWNCHNPVIIVDADGLSIGPDSTLVPHDGTEHDLDCLGDLDPDGAVNRIARRLENIPPEFWERHPVRQAAIRQWLEEQLEEYSVGCDEYISDAFRDDYETAVAEAALVWYWEQVDDAVMRVRIGHQRGDTGAVVEKFLRGTGEQLLEIKSSLDESGEASSCYWVVCDLMPAIPDGAACEESDLDDISSLYDLLDE